MTILVAVTGWDAGPWSRRLKLLAPQRPMLETQQDGRFTGDAAELDAVSYVLAWKPREDVLASLKNLKVIFSLGAGVDHLLHLQRLPDVPVVRIVDDDLTGRMREYIVWQVLDQHRRGLIYRQQQAQRRWDDLPQPAAGEVTVGIMGLGVLGRDAAQALAQLGFRVIGWNRGAKPLDPVECHHGRDGLEAFLGQTDILVSLLPLTPETAGMIDHALLSRLKRDGPLGGPVLINAGRGGSQVDADIARALADGTLVGASLDVFEVEPLPADSPLWDRPGLTITPHNAAVSSPEALARNIIGQIEAFEAGDGLRNVVDRDRGY